MQRRAWILGGALAGGAAICTAFYARSRRLPEMSRARLTHLSGPFALPPGFEAKVVSRSGDRLGDGTRSPDMPDGMACFAEPAGRWTLMRNHELAQLPAQGAYPRGQPSLAFDPAVQGGVSRLVLDPTTLDVVSSNMVLTGTLRNCGGGPCPWGWISCEETTERGHGYSFLCRSDASSLQKPRIIKQYGRFRHEAVAFDPRSGRAYLTEDEEDGCLYRFTPRSVKKPFSGKLEVLRVKEKSNMMTRSQCVVGEALEVDWVSIDDPEAELRPTRLQARARGAAIFARCEGAWLDGAGVVFTATTGGSAGRGQVFRLSFSDKLTLVAESESDEQFNGPDNITVAPWGDLVVAEDGMGPQHLFGITREGNCYPILRNQMSESELAGVCFSPDGSVLFCNVQWDGLTVAVRGPFRELFAAS